MYYLAEVFPKLREIKLPFTRDQFILLMAAVNEIFLGIDIYLAHSISGTIVPREWIPIIFGPTAGVLLLLAGAIAVKNRPIAVVLANIVLIGSIVVGLLGAYFHLVRGIMPSAPLTQKVTIDLLVWAPPVIGPLMFSLVGWMGISAAWIEDPADSGQLVLFRGRKLPLPVSKTRAYLVMICMGILATLISSVLDHARTDFRNPWLWLPTAVGVFSAVVAFALAAYDEIRKQDVVVYVIAMGLLIGVGLIGLVLHILLNLTSEGLVIQERFIRGAPFLAPTLYANMGLLGLLVLLDPTERPKDKS
ncbi:MAG TPA: hypothetical protein VLA32_10320 [Anaerolineales bacterium]|nr:hypothetical protein [Anaerolineales bacterium]